MAGKGEKIITERDMQARLRQLETQINSVLAFLVFIETSEIKNFMIQGASQVFNSGGSAVTFTHPYKVGTTPLVFMTPNTNQSNWASPVSATGFTGHNAGSALSRWIAIGERG